MCRASFWHVVCPLKFQPEPWKKPERQEGGRIRSRVTHSGGLSLTVSHHRGSVVGDVGDVLQLRRTSDKNAAIQRHSSCMKMKAKR